MMKITIQRARGHWLAVCMCQPQEQACQMERICIKVRFSWVGHSTDLERNSFCQNIRVSNNRFVTMEFHQKHASLNLDIIGDFN